MKPVTTEFLDGLKTCLVLSKITKKSRAKDLVLVKNQMIVNEGTMIINHKASGMGEFSVSDKTSAIINILQPNTFCVLSDKIVFEYGGSYVLLPRINYEIKMPVVEQINNMLSNLKPIQINTEMVSKLGFIGKLTKNVKVSLKDHILTFSSVSPSAYEECEIPDADGEFEASFSYPALQHFFIDGNQFDVTKFGIGDPMLVLNPNYHVFISNLK
jgi:hypothetical protein